MATLQRKDAFSAGGTGSLFSDTKTMPTGTFLNQAPKPSLFGSLSTPASTGASFSWGAPSTTTANPQGSLFPMTSSVTTTNPSQGGGLFPTSTVNPTSTTIGGSFFGPSNPTQGSSLFPSNPPNTGGPSAFQTPQKQGLFGPTTTLGTPALGGVVTNPNPIISNSLASGLSGSIPGSTPSWPVQPTTNQLANGVITSTLASAFAPCMTGIATTNPSFINPYQNQPVGLLNSVFPTPQQLSSLFTPSGINQVSTNKQLNLLNNPSLQTNGTLSSALANWFLDANNQNKKTSTQQLISAPLIQLVSPAFKELIPIIKQPPTFLRKLPNQFLNSTPTFYESHRRSKSPPLAMDFSGCRHLSTTVSKNNAISPYEDLYKQVSFYSSQKRSKVQQQNKVDPYSNTLKSIFDYKNTQKDNKRFNYYSSSFSNQQQEQTLYANQKQLLKSFKFIFTPSIQKLRKTPKQNLQCIHNFKVSNQYGSVQFNKPINLLYKSFDDLIHIDQDSIEINPPLIIEDAVKGQNDVIMTFYNYSRYLEHIKGNSKAERKFQEVMHKTLDRMNMQFISFDKEEGNLVVKI